MIRIGIVGAENSHSAAIARTLNIDKSVPGFRAVAIWGETDEFAAKSAEAGRIPAIVKQPADMIGKIDAVIVDHRHAKYHLEAAEPFLTARMPMFIDKPFCYRLADGKRFLERATKAGVPVTSFSTVPLQKCSREYAKAIRKAKVVSVASAGPCDLDSKYGGVFFYGIHQVDMLLECFGTDVVRTAVSRSPGSPNASATMWWTSGMVGTVQCLNDQLSRNSGMQFLAVTDSGPLAVKVQYDANIYLTGIKTFCRMFKTGKEPFEHRRFLASIAVLEAMEKSVNAGGQVQEVEKV
ncbi:MAG: Gfo/Idh/MocA family protein [Phycisphaerae bacterium]